MSVFTPYVRDNALVSANATMATGIPTYDDLIELTKIDHRQGKRW